MLFKAVDYGGTLKVLELFQCRMFHEIIFAYSVYSKQTKHLLALRKRDLSILIYHKNHLHKLGKVE